LQVVLNNALVTVLAPDCSPASVRQRVTAFWSAVGASAVGVMPDNITSYVQAHAALVTQTQKQNFKP
jgi:hypothetical protein